MKKLAAIVLLCASISTAFSQEGPWAFFWTPRPVAFKSLGAMGAELAPMWLFKPSITMNTMFIHKGVVNPIEVGFLSGAGVGLTYEHSIVTPESMNTADYSVSLSLLLTGSTDIDPVLQPTVCLTFGLWNNLVQVGPAYTLSGPRPAMDRFGVILNLALTPTQN